MKIDSINTKVWNSCNPLCSHWSCTYCFSHSLFLS